MNGDELLEIVHREDRLRRVNDLPDNSGRNFDRAAARVVDFKLATLEIPDPR